MWQKLGVVIGYEEQGGLGPDITCEQSEGNNVDTCTGSAPETDCTTGHGH